MKKMMLTMILALVMALPRWLGRVGPHLPRRWMRLWQVKHRLLARSSTARSTKIRHVDYKGQRIYFCCTDCVPVFKKNPEAYLKRLEQEGGTPEKSPGGK